MSGQGDNRWLHFLGVELSPVSHTERLLSAVGSVYVG
jgi:hypothetical protein